MKQTLQLRLGQQLTMTPQLQQAIRLLQLSTLDLKQEIQEALDSNLMLELEEDHPIRESLAEQTDASATATDANSNEQEINTEPTAIPEELPVDSGWDDTYDSTTPPVSGASKATQESGATSDFLSQSKSTLTLHDHLTWQLNLTPLNEIDYAIAVAIIDSISETGYLTASLTDILGVLNHEEAGLEEIEAVLHRIQHFDPPGVGARTPQECLLLQLQQLPADTPWREKAIELVREYFDLLSNQDHNQIKRRLQLTDEELHEINRLVLTLDPHPGTAVAELEPEYVVPDVFVQKKNRRWQVSLNGSSTPKLRINQEYAALIRRTDQSQDNLCLKNHLQEARWFIKSLESRNETLLRVAKKIVEFQRGFLDFGEEAMRPLVLRDVAEALDMHESTISRVTTRKYMRTPRGTYELKYFFSSHVSTTGGGECSATAIRALIKKLIAAEKPNKPLSDNKIATILAEQGIEIARRTVAKYRESMAIPPSNERKRLM